ncbi:NF038129 family PEP-CTERM protein [Massilia sp. IC2-476]|uniref:NF038129 family PEP-CTERM protein n=1 Tax=Massilia sp. IC2-476 TaxID=2887199 RepID=UPI001D1127C8|nr:NF038129 family PEP-CTERM protein [Massilia sp. IC2-476]MCC2972060.1 NF038129 family PEP-CTERM protein [Massilia sp. IC2-476]
MFNATTFLRQAALALLLATSSLAALAGPISYHVNVDTTGRTGAGALDLMFHTFSSTQVSATLSNFSGAFGAASVAEQVTFNPDGSIVLANLPDFGSYLKFDLSLGGAFGFDILFSDDQSLDTGAESSLLSIGLYDAAGVLGDPYGIVQFELTPGQGIGTPYADAAFAQVSEVAAAVPEPADWLLMGTGLALLGASLRRRSTAAR